MSSSLDIEHASLRTEILENGNYGVSTANFVVTLTGAAILAAFEFRNPYLALLPLFPLYYGYLIAFSASQTIARTSVYLRLVEKERYENLLYKLRNSSVIQYSVNEIFANILRSSNLRA